MEDNDYFRYPRRNSPVSGHAFESNECAIFPSTHNGCRHSEDYLVRVYIDDVVIFSELTGEHLDQIQEMFRQIHDHGLKIELSKCQFAQASVQLLAHVVAEDTNKVHENIRAAFKDSLTSTTQTELCSVLGLAG